jgi:hypothetical protein
MIRTCKLLLIATLAATRLFVADVSAQSSGGPYHIERSVITGGGGSLNGGSFQLSGTFGQSTTAPLSGSGYGFYGGFWPPVAGSAPTDLIFADGFDS